MKAKRLFVVQRKGANPMLYLFPLAILYLFNSSHSWAGRNLANCVETNASVACAKCQRSHNRVCFAASPASYTYQVSVRLGTRNHPSGRRPTRTRTIAVEDPGCRLHPNLTRWLDTLSQKFGDRTVLINSAYRSPAYNRSIGGASRSQHTICRAVDFSIPGVNNSQLMREARKLSPSVGWSRQYRWGIHIDARGY
jgi:hypothetical protein